MVLFRRRSTHEASSPPAAVKSNRDDNRDDNNDSSHGIMATDITSTPNMMLLRRRTTSALSSSSKRNNDNGSRLSQSSPQLLSQQQTQPQLGHHQYHRQQQPLQQPLQLQQRRHPLWSRLLRSCATSVGTPPATASTATTTMNNRPNSTPILTTPSTFARATTTTTTTPSTTTATTPLFLNVNATNTDGTTSTTSSRIRIPTILDYSISIPNMKSVSTLRASTSTVTAASTRVSSSSTRTKQHPSSDSNSITSVDDDEDDDDDPLVLLLKNTAAAVEDGSDDDDAVPCEVQIVTKKSSQSTTSTTTATTITTSSGSISHVDLGVASAPLSCLGGGDHDGARSGSEEEEEEENDEAYWESLHMRDHQDHDHHNQKGSNSINTPRNLYLIAVSFAERDEYERALAATERGIVECNNNGNHGHIEKDVVVVDNNNTIVLVESEEDESDLFVELQVLKAQILGRMGRYRDSLSCYQSLLERLDSTNSGIITPADRASILYTCGRLCSCLEEHKAAVDYYHQELQATLPLVLELGDDGGSAGAEGGDVIRASISRIYHEIAHVYKDGLGELGKSLEYLQLALETETDILAQTKLESRNACPHCSVVAAAAASSSSPASVGKSKKTATATTTAAARCPLHRVAVQQALQQIRETKLCMGRIHYELGDLDQAIRLTLQ